MIPSRPPDAEVLLRLTSQTWEGEIKYVQSGYRPVYDVREDYWTSAHHEFLEVDGVSTGETARAHVWFITPEVYPNSLWVDRILTVAEGSRPVGSATIIQIFNPVLKRS